MWNPCNCLPAVLMCKCIDNQLRQARMLFLQSSCTSQSWSWSNSIADTSAQPVWHYPAAAAPSSSSSSSTKKHVSSHPLKNNFIFNLISKVLLIVSRSSPIVGFLRVSVHDPLRSKDKYPPPLTCLTGTSLKCIVGMQYYEKSRIPQNAGSYHWMQKHRSNSWCVD